MRERTLDYGTQYGGPNGYYESLLFSDENGSWYNPYRRWTQIGNFATYFPKGSSNMTDSQGRFKSFNPCEHHTVKYDGSPVIIEEEGEYYHGLYRRWCIKTTEYHFSPEMLLINGHGIPSSFDMSMLDSQASLGELATRDAMPRIEPDISIVNFLLELKDFKQMFKLWDSKHNVAQNLNNGFLNWSFGWKPFLNDLKTIWNSHQKVTQHRERLERRGQEAPVINHGASSSGHTSSWVQCGSAYGDYNIYRRDIVSRKVSVTVKVSYGPANFNDDAFTRLRLQQMGVCLNPSIIWNAIPFSFVADWFFPIGDALDRFSLDTFTPNHTLEILGYTILETGVREFGVGKDPSNLTVGLRGERRTFSRVPDDALSGSPLSTSGVDAMNPFCHFSWLSDSQATVGTSLLYSFTYS